eukprot:1736626-Amphidinium_carterae.1
MGPTEADAVQIESNSSTSCCVAMAKNASKVVRPTIFCLMQTADLLRRLPSLGAGSWASRYVGSALAHHCLM